MVCPELFLMSPFSEYVSLILKREHVTLWVTNCHPSAARGVEWSWRHSDEDVVLPPVCASLAS